MLYDPKPVQPMRQREDKIITRSFSHYLHANTPLHQTWITETVAYTNRWLIRWLFWNKRNKDLQQQNDCPGTSTTDSNIFTQILELSLICITKAKQSTDYRSAQIWSKITSAPETLKSEGAFSTLKALIFPSSTKADHLKWYRSKEKEKNQSVTNTPVYISSWTVSTSTSTTFY